MRVPPQAEFAALFLPSLLRTFFDNPIDAFEYIEDDMFYLCTTVVRMHVPTSASYRFLREHPTETVEFRAKTLGLIADWADRKQLVSPKIRLPSRAHQADDLPCAPISHRIRTGPA